MKKSPQADSARHRSRLRFETLNAFVDRGIVDGKLNPSDVAVWLTLYRHAGPDGIVKITVQTIQRSTGLARRTVLLSLKRMRTARMLRTVKRGGLNQGASRHAIFPYPMGA